MAPNIYQPDYDEREAPAGFRARRARIGRDLDMELIGCSLWQVCPGEAAYPYHYHWWDEELVIVLCGKPTLRTPQGVRELAPGDAVRFPKGRTGAHQILNRSEENITFLAISPGGHPDVVVYPDSAKLGINERRSNGDGIKVYFRQDDEVDYWLEEDANAPVTPPADRQSPQNPTV